MSSHMYDYNCVNFFVFSNFSSRIGHMQLLLFSISTKIVFAPKYCAQLADATNVIGEVTRL